MQTRNSLWVERCAGLVRSVILLCVIAASAWAGEPQNLRFEIGEVGKSPEGWVVPTPGFVARVVEDQGVKAKRAVEFGPEAAGARPAPFGNLMQAFDASAYRGKRIVVRSDVRLVFPEGADREQAAKTWRAQMWVRVDRKAPAGGRPMQGFFDNMGDRPVQGLRAAGYQTCTISGVVEDDAESINIGVMVLQGASVRVAGFEVFAAPGDGQGDAPAAELSERGVQNLVALAKLAGYVRHFHPSDQAALANWPEFLIRAAERVERSKDAKELEESLSAVFAEIAPTVQIWEGGPEAAPAELARPEGAVRHTSWKHTGVGLAPDGQTSTPGIYSSRREKRDLEHPDAPKAGQSVVKSLGGGISARIPVSVYLNAARKTLPESEGEAPKLERPEWWTPSGNDRTTRLVDVMLAWNVFQHFYPYFGEGGCSAEQWQEALPVALRAAAADKNQAEFLVTLQELIGTLNDGHGGVYATSVARPMPLKVALGWAGDLRKELVVTAVADGVEWVRPGDVVLAIDGVEVADWYAAVRPRISSATVQWTQHRAATDPSFVGAADADKVKLRVQRVEDVREVEVVRISDVRQIPKRKQPENGEELTPGVLYFDLNGAESPALNGLMEKLVRAKGVVFDLRGYPAGAGYELLGHLTDKTIESARWNVPVTVLPDQDAAGRTWLASGRWNIKPVKPRLGADGQKIVFLTGGGAISYAESCMGIVENYKLGEIVGEATAGTNGNVNPFMLPGGYSISWTGMKVLKHDKSRHHGVGIQPTMLVTPTVEGIRAGRDEVLDAGVKAASDG